MFCQISPDFFPRVCTLVKNHPHLRLLVSALCCHKESIILAVWVFLSPGVYSGNTSPLDKLHTGIWDDFYLHQRKISLQLCAFNSAYHLNWTSAKRSTNRNWTISQIRPEDVVYKYHHIHNVLSYQHSFMLQHSPCQGVMGEIKVWLPIQCTYFNKENIKKWSY